MTIDEQALRTIMTELFKESEARLEAKFSESEARLEAKLEEKLETKLDAKFAEAKRELRQDIQQELAKHSEQLTAKVEHEISAGIEYMTDKFNALAEVVQTVTESLSQKANVQDLQETNQRISVLFQAAKASNAEFREYKRRTRRLEAAVLGT